MIFITTTKVFFCDHSMITVTAFTCDHALWSCPWSRCDHAYIFTGVIWVTEHFHHRNTPRKPSCVCYNARRVLLPLWDESVKRVSGLRLIVHANFLINWKKIQNVYYGYVCLKWGTYMHHLVIPRLENRLNCQFHDSLITVLQGGIQRGKYC